jgi:RNA polymerase sigma-70 factor (ECF subfamily)
MPESNSRFETTRWSLVLRAGRADGRQAASELCARYWWPVYAFFRSQGARDNEAEDITQEFFGDIDRRRDLCGLDPERGRFRSWLRACAKNHLYRYRKGQRALKRDEEQVPLSAVSAVEARAAAVAAVIEGKRGSERVSLTAAPHTEGSPLEPKDLLTPEHDFDRSWALALHARVMNRLRAHYTENGKLAIFRSLEAILSGACTEQSDSELSQALGMRDEGTLRVARCVMKKQVAPLYRRYLRAEIGETVSDPEDIDHEIRELLAALSQPLGIVERGGAGDVRASPRGERRAG